MKKDAGFSKAGREIVSAPHSKPSAQPLHRSMLKKRDLTEGYL
jgi:hypothetical protein